MRLKSFHTIGFKSFADKTELKFDKGITAVVGPNGSGKSNLSDAIRWALGEQSAKYLRGSKMEDIIFNGTGKRRALGMAEVDITFDNSDHSLPMDFEEIRLTRRLYRNGDSDYQINNKNCRLKDITDLLADTGLGKGSMSIIGQNKIDEILNSRPEDRRALFEEAAGIAKYRLRKKDAVRKLNETADNLTRINDIAVEIDAQMGPLAIAAEKTRKYNELSEQQRMIRLSLLARKLSGMREQGELLENKKAQAQADYAEQTAKLSSQQAYATKLQLDLDELGEKYNLLQDEIKNLETTLSDLRGKRNVLDERTVQSKNAQERLAKHQEKLQEQVAELEERMAGLAADFDAADNEREKAALIQAKLQDERDAKAAELAQAEKDSDTAQASFFSDMQELITLRNEVRSLEQEQEQRRRQREALRKRIDETEEQANAAGSSYNSVLAEQDRLRRTEEQVQGVLDDLREKMDVTRKQYADIAGKQHEVQRKLTAAETREQSLQRMQDNYEGFGYGLKTVMKAQAPWRKNIIGAVAELINVDAEYVAAMETALGEGAQNLVTRDAQTAKAAIAYLKQQKSGRATFLPLDTVQRRQPTAEERGVLKLAGVRGFAYELVQYDEAYSAAVQFLLGRIIIADHMDAALAAAKYTRYRMRVVTMDGDVVNAGGSMSGGARRQKEGYLSRTLDIEQAQAEVEKLHKEMLGLQEELEEVEAVGKAQKTKHDEQQAIWQQTHLKGQETDIKLKRLQDEKVRLDESLALLLDDRKQVNEAWLADRTKLQGLQKELSEKESQDTAAKEELERLKKLLANLGSAVTALDNQLADARIAVETSTVKAQAMSERMQNLDQDTLRVRTEIASNVQEDERLAKVIEDAALQQTQLHQQEQDGLGKLAELSGGKESYLNERHELQSKQDAAQEQLRTIQKDVLTYEGKLRQTELDLARYSSDYEHMVAELAEDYQLDESSLALMDFSEQDHLDLKQLQKQESKLSLAITALGPINAMAITEYEAIQERSNFIHKQYDDLIVAKNNLEEVIAQLNSGMTKRFKEAFVKINEYFADCYSKLFGGGTAMLRLSDTGDLLDAGIEIDAQPPGKKLQSLFLLSGGERALTVIALLFALLTYKPAPFCILDEIDAPLDDANIQRFANFLREYSARTQFIMITHRKGTMESADVMYGVTMQESGVSKLLSVKISQDFD